MRHFSYPFIIKPQGIFLVLCIGFLSANTPNCAICFQPLDSVFSIDVWGNTFHTQHEDEGIFCNSCSRIISQGVTQGGYVYSDGRHLCSLCVSTAVNNNSAIQTAYESVVLLFEKVGISDVAENIPVALVSIHQLNQEAGNLSHAKLKGFTQIKTVNERDELKNKFYISILSGLPRIEFESVLSHELLHIWLHQNQIRLSLETEEGFCNLGRYLIYQNDQTHFANIHLQAMENDHDPIYGVEYRKMKAKLEQKGWKNLILYILNYNGDSNQF